MSTENMRKLMMLAESLDEDYRDDPNRPGWKDEEGEWHKYEDCPTCHGWGEVVPGKDSREDFDYDFDDVQPCPDCGPEDGLAAQGKSKIIKQIANDLDMDWTDLPLSESFTRKHFQTVADAVSKIENDEARRLHAETLADVFAEKNPRFKRDLFMKACGVEDELDEDSYRDLKFSDYPLRSLGSKTLARKLIPGLGKREAGERQEDHWFNSRMFSDTKLHNPDWEPDEADTLEWDRSKRQGRRYNRIMRGENPFKKSGWELEEQGPGDDAEWDAEWARMDGDDERADDLEWDAEFARMDAEPECSYCDDEEPLDDFPCLNCGSKQFIGEDTSEFRLAEIIGKDGIADLLADLRSGGIDYNGSYFQKLYWHFLDEYPDEIPVGSRTGRPEDPEEYVLDFLQRYHEEEIDRYIGQDIRGKPLQVESKDDGDVPSRRVEDHELAHALLTKVESALNFLAKGMEAESERGNFDQKQQAIMLRRDLKGIKAYLESGQEISPQLFSIVQRANNAVNELTDLSYEFDDVQMDVQDAENLLYLHLTGRPVAIDEAGCPCGKEGCECGPDCDCEPVEEDRKKRERPEVKGINDKYDDKLNCKHCGSYYCTSKFGGECPEIQMDMFGDIELDEIVESVLGEGQPKDYEMSNDELAAEIEDETSEFERDSIDPEIEDEELGLRFD